MTTTATSLPSAGDLLGGRYRLDHVLGRGGAGVVWRGWDTQRERAVAVKISVPPAHLAPDEAEIARSRVLREARAAARLVDPAIVEVLDVVDDGDGIALVLELVDAVSLAETVVTDGPLHPAVVARIGLDVLSALVCAHESGILHRDVKPGNVLLQPDGRVRLADFGIASIEGDPSLTATGLLLGSPAYISPERARTGIATTDADLWSLAATLYTAVEGVPAYDGGDALATLVAITSGRRRPCQTADDLEPVLAAVLDHPASERPGAGALRVMLEAVAAEPVPPAAEPVPTGAAPAAVTGGVPSVDVPTVTVPTVTVPVVDGPAVASAADLLEDDLGAGLTPGSSSAPAPDLDPPTAVLTRADLALHGLASDDAAPVAPAPADLVPAADAPVDQAPADLAPADVAAADLAPADVAAADPAPADVAPADPAPAPAPAPDQPGSTDEPTQLALPVVDPPAAADVQGSTAPAGVGPGTEVPGAQVPAEVAAAGAAPVETAPVEAPPAETAPLVAAQVVAAHDGSAAVETAPADPGTVDLLKPTKTGAESEVGPAPAATATPEVTPAPDVAAAPGPTPATSAQNVPVVPVVDEPRPASTGTAPDRRRHATKPTPQVVRRRRITAGVVVVVLAGLIGLGVERSLNSSDSSSSITTAGRAALPAGYTGYSDPDSGWTAGIPAGWTVDHSTAGRTVLTDPKTHATITVQVAPGAVSSVVAGWQADDAAALKGRLGYALVRIGAADGGTGTTAADWEFTDGKGSGLRHVLERGVVAGNYGYAITSTSAATDWAAVSPTVQAFLSTFHPAA